MTQASRLVALAARVATDVKTLMTSVNSLTLGTIAKPATTHGVIDFNFSRLTKIDDPVGPNDVVSKQFFTNALIGGTTPVGSMVMWPAPVSQVPSSWLALQGQSLLRTDYPDLFAAIGTTWGAVDSTHFTLPDMRGRFAQGATASDGSVTNGAAGATAHALAATGGEEKHTLVIDEMPAHNHPTVDSGHVHGVTGNGHAHSTGAWATSGHAHGINGEQPGYAGSATSPTGSASRVTPAAFAGHNHGGATGGPNAAGSGTNSSGTGISIQGAGSAVSVGQRGNDASHNNLPPFATVHFIIKAFAQ